MCELPLLSVIALLESIPSEKLQRGQVGTIVERIAPGIYEVEFSDHYGQTYASLPLSTDPLIQLHHEPKHQAA